MRSFVLAMSGSGILNYAGGRRPALRVLEHLGYAARGLIYLLIGSFAVVAALDSGTQPRGITGALQAIADTRLRLAAAVALALGLGCFAGYFTIVGLWDYRRGQDRRHWLLAAGRLGDAAIYVGFVVAVLGAAFGGPAQGQGEQQAHGWAAWAMQLPFGRGLVGIAGILVLACGLGLIGWALAADIEAHSDLPAREKHLLAPIGRFGVGGRGLAISMLGVYWLSAAIDADPSKAHVLGGALQELRRSDYGAALLLVFGLAFVASALLDVMDAIFRRPQPD